MRMELSRDWMLASNSRTTHRNALGSVQNDPMICKMLPPMLGVTPGPPSFGVETAQRRGGTATELEDYGPEECACAPPSQQHRGNK